MKKLFATLALVFVFQFSGFTQDEINCEQIAFDYFVDSIFNHHDGIEYDVLYDGKVADKFMTYADIYTCFEDRDYFQKIWYLSSTKNSSPIDLNINFNSKKIGKYSIKNKKKLKFKKRKYILTIYRATQYNDRYYVLIMISQKYRVKYFTFEFLKNERKINRWCFVG